MLDMGFIPDVRRILRQLPAKRQTLFFSATMPPRGRRAVARDAAVARHDQHRAHGRAGRRACTQSVYPVRGDLKSSLLVELLKSRGDMESVLVFTRTKHRTNRVAEFLASHRIHVARIHGNRSQAQRTQALDGLQDAAATASSSRPTSPRAASTSRT